MKWEEQKRLGLAVCDVQRDRRKRGRKAEWDVVEAQGDGGSHYGNYTPRTSMRGHGLD